MRRTLPFAAFAIALLAIAAGCGGGGSSSPAPTVAPSTAPSVAPSSTTAAVSTSTTGSATISMGSGVTTAITIPESASGSGTVTITGSAGAPTGITPYAVRRSASYRPFSTGSPTPLGYVDFQPSAALSFSTFPSFSITLPTTDSTTGESFYIAFYTNDPSFSGNGSWSTVLGPASVSSQTVSFTGGAVSPAITLNSGYQYVFCLYEVASSSPSSSPSASPSTAPTPEYAFPTPTATMASGSDSFSLTYNAVSVSATFGAATTTTLDVNLGQNTGDVTPAISPADNATADYAPVVYISFYNGSTSTVTLGSDSPAVTLTDASVSATECELDVYTGNGSGSDAWQKIASGSFANGAGTIPAAAIPDGGSVQFAPGQQLVAIACNSAAE